MLVGTHMVLFIKEVELNQTKIPFFHEMICNSCGYTSKIRVFAVAVSNKLR